MAALALDAPIPAKPGCPMGFGGGFDLTDTALFAGNHAHDAWRHLRRYDPVSWHPGRGRIPGFWSITRYEDVRRVSRDTETFVSGRGYLMTTNPKRPGRAAGVGKVLLGIDAPRHLRIRRLVNAWFAPRIVNRLEPWIAAETVRLIETIDPRDSRDFVADVTEPLSLALVGRVLGIPLEDRHRLATYGHRILGTSGRNTGLRETTMGRGVQTVSSQFAVQGLLKYFSRLVTSRRRQPGDDVVTYLTSSEQGDERLSDEELVHFCYLLFLAGHETTRNSISGGMLALLEHPAEWERLRRDPGLLPTAVEEMLRWTSSIMHMARVASRDVDIRGQRIRAGEKVVLWYPSANRDEAVFAAPDRFDIGRHPNPHLAFGLGQHFCLGAGLARVQMRTLFAALIERRVTIELDGDVQRLHSVFIGGITRLPVRFGGAVRKCPFAHERIA